MDQPVFQKMKAPLLTPVENRRPTTSMSSNSGSSSSSNLTEEQAKENKRIRVSKFAQKNQPPNPTSTSSSTPLSASNPTGSVKKLKSSNLNMGFQMPTPKTPSSYKVIIPIMLIFAGRKSSGGLRSLPKNDSDWVTLESQYPNTILKNVTMFNKKMFEQHLFESSNSEMIKDYFFYKVGVHRNQVLIFISVNLRIRTYINLYRFVMHILHKRSMVNQN